MDTFLKLVAVFVLLAVLRNVGAACYKKGTEEADRFVGVVFMAIVIASSVWAVWFLGARI